MRFVLGLILPRSFQFSRDLFPTLGERRSFEFRQRIDLVLFNLFTESGNEFVKFVRKPLGFCLCGLFVVQANADTPRCRYDAIAVDVPAVPRTAPSILRFLIQDTFGFDGVGIIHQRLRSVRIEDVRCLAADWYVARFDDVISTFVPQSTRQPVVGSLVGTAGFRVNRHVLAQHQVEIFVVPEQTAKLLVFVRPADLLSRIPAHRPGHFRLVAIVSHSFCQELDSFLHPRISKLEIIVFDRDVVRQVVRLILPNLDEMRLKLHQLVHSANELFPLFGFLVVVGFHQQDIGRDSFHAQGRQLHRLAGRIDFPKLGGGEIVLGSKLR